MNSSMISDDSSVEVISLTYYSTHIVNHRKYFARNISCNLSIEKNVRTKEYKRRLTVYDKEKELRRSDNQDFIDILTDPEGLLGMLLETIMFPLLLVW